MTNFAHHPFAIPAFAMKVLRANATPALVVVATIVLASLVILAAPLASAQTFMFNRADFATGTGPAVVAVGDFRGNGHMDVVTGNDDTANTVSVVAWERRRNVCASRRLSSRWSAHRHRRRRF